MTLADLEKARDVWKRVKARMAGVEEYEQYDAEQHHDAEDGDDYEDEYAEHSDEDEMEHRAPDDEGWQPHPDPQLRGLVWVPPRGRVAKPSAPAWLTTTKDSPGAQESRSDGPPALTADERIAETWREVLEWKRKNLPYDTRRRIRVPIPR